MRSRGVARAVVRDWVRRLASGLITGAGFTYRLLRGYPVPPTSVDRILVIRLDLLGDVLHSLRAVESLHAGYPSAHITMLTLPYTAPLARLHPLVDKVVEVDTNLIRRPQTLLAARTWYEYRRIYRYLRTQRFDLAVSIYGRMGSLCAFLSGARRTVGFEAEAYPYLLTDPVPGGRHRERIPEVDYALRLAVHVGGKDVPPRRLIVPSSHAVMQAGSLLRSTGVRDGDTVVALHAGSRNGAAKRWPATSWSRFADELYQRIGARTVLVGASSDAAIADDVARGGRSPVVSLAGKTDIEGLIAVLQRADLVASGDSGPLHLAAALGRPLLAVYGPTDPVIYGPHDLQAPMALHRADLPCSPCYTLAATAECPLGDPICMRLVSVSRMVESAVRLLQPSSLTQSS